MDPMTIHNHFLNSIDLFVKYHIHSHRLINRLFNFELRTMHNGPQFDYKKTTLSPLVMKSHYTNLEN